MLYGIQYMKHNCIENNAITSLNVNLYTHLRNNEYWNPVAALKWYNMSVMALVNIVDYAVCANGCYD